jgi:phosphoribosylglycinamide formyltransferase-1
MKLGFLASHNGSNLQAIVDACKCGALDAVPAVVVSNNGDSGALARAREEGIPGYHLSSRTHPDPMDLDLAIGQAMRSHSVDIVVLAGYLKKLGPKILADYHGRILNIHPALLPKYGGKGMYGMKIHEAVIAAGDDETGVSIHIVDGDYDTGRIVAQSRVPVESTDSPQTLAQRVLKQEHAFFPKVLQKIVTGEIELPGN